MDRHKKLQEILAYVRKIHVEKNFFWVHDSITQIERVERELGEMVDHPRTDLEAQLRADIFRLHTTLSNAQAEFKAGHILQTYQQEEADLLNSILKELGDHLLQYAGPGSQAMLPAHLKNTMRWLLIKHQCATPQELLTLLRQQGAQLHDRLLVEAYVEMLESRVPAEFLINNFFQAVNQEQATEQRIHALYQQTLREPYSYNSTIRSFVTGGMPRIDSLTEIFSNMLLDDGIGNCYSSAYTLYISLMHYGFRPYLILGKRTPEHYGHAALVVDLGAELLYLDPGNNVEAPIRFWEHADSEEPSFQTKNVRLKYLKNNEFMLQVHNAAKGWNDLCVMENRPVTISEFKREWLRLKSERLRNVNDIIVRINSLQQYRGQRVNMLITPGKERPFDYRVKIRTKESMSDIGDFTATPFHLVEGGEDEHGLLKDVDIDPERFLDLMLQLQQTLQQRSKEINALPEAA